MQIPTPEAVIVRTARLVLRRATMGDVDAFHKIFTDPTTMRFWSRPPHTTYTQSEDWVRSMVDGAGDDFVITLQDKVLGKAGFYADPELGFILQRAHTGHGYAREAVRAVLNRAFDERKLKCVRADVDPRNERSLKLLAHLGFREIESKQGTYLHGTELCDSVYLELRPEDYVRAE